jgi:dCTP deaminase
VILTGDEIASSWQSGHISITPFRAEQINPNSYDVRLAGKLAIYTARVLDPQSKNSIHLVSIDQTGRVLFPGTVYLGWSEEVIGATRSVMFVHGKSSNARLGIFVQDASKLSPRERQRILLQISVVQPTKVFAGMRIAHVSFFPGDREYG